MNVRSLTKHEQAIRLRRHYWCFHYFFCVFLVASPQKYFEWADLRSRKFIKTSYSSTFCKPPFLYLPLKRFKLRGDFCKCILYSMIRVCAICGHFHSSLVSSKLIIVNAWLNRKSGQTGRTSSHLMHLSWTSEKKHYIHETIYTNSNCL